MAASAYQPVEAVRVFAWDTEIGAVVRDPKQRAFVFQYTDGWIRRGIELSPLHMPLAREPYTFPLLPEATFKSLPALLADSLPDDFGNNLINGFLAQKGVGSRSITALDRLAYMGARSMGALQFKPVRGPRQAKPTAIQLGELVFAARKALQGNFDGDREAEAAIKNLIQVGTSAGGARAKAVVAWNPSTNEIMSGQVPAPEGFSPWLLKLDGVAKDTRLGPSDRLGSGKGYGRIEYAYYLMATAAGMAMSDCRLLEENDRAHFMTRRFDREGGDKHHIQTLCAMDHLDYKMLATHDYAQYFLVIQRLGLPQSAYAEAFRRMCFNVCAANCDDHTKNFSFLLRRGFTWELSPAYDITHAHDPNNQWLREHLMAVNGKFSGITRKDLLAVGDRFEVPGMKAIIGDVADAVSLWKEFAKEAGVPTDIASSIAKDHGLND
ncbi:type II toxin-antitoxin system HipA family toxin [Dyella sp. 2RAB6]|uniref:type II toxin-antitoxin system HipA family toxin n=1 Tax=Dyella sp. 2RAB6 TaxID=3232992 RepID=UPI003F902507